jgi:phosphoribosylformylglycinamidine cyclo-ligase
VEGIAQDALIMNIDDLLCVGATDNILLSSTIGRNRNLITADVLGHYWNRRTYQGASFIWCNHSFHRWETADRDLVRTLS